MDHAIVTEVVGTPTTASAPAAPITTAVGSTTGESFAVKKAEAAQALEQSVDKRTRQTTLSLSAPRTSKACVNALRARISLSRARKKHALLEWTRLNARSTTRTARDAKR